MVRKKPHFDQNNVSYFRTVLQEQATIQLPMTSTASHSAQWLQE
ncbi:hypothetical protein [Bacillus sp. 3255]|nr:hypothetical protein [Bacillus sp. 3255]